MSSSLGEVRNVKRCVVLVPARFEIMKKAGQGHETTARAGISMATDWPSSTNPNFSIFTNVTHDMRKSSQLRMLVEHGILQISM
jgi:hypothetical protein